MREETSPDSNPPSSGLTPEAPSESAESTSTGKMESDSVTPDISRVDAPHAASERSASELPAQITSLRLNVSATTGEKLVEAPPIHSNDDSIGYSRWAPEAVSAPTVASSSANREPASEEPDPPTTDKTSNPYRTSPQPLTQSMTLLASMMLMLVIARYTVPRVVEEIRYSWRRGQLRAEYEMGNEGLRNVSLDSLSRAYQMVTSAVEPSVVHIDVRRAKAETSEMMRRIHGDDLFSMADQGSGVIVDADGYVLTNHHVVVDGNRIWVTLGDGRRLPATVVGSDVLTDLAVLKIDAEELMPIHWGDSDSLKVGSPVWAVGSPFGLDRTITFGILSGKHRMVSAGQVHGASKHYQDFMQSDVAVNPGNSGGPLVDARGTLVGINTAIVGDTYQGVSFSIPSNVTRQIYERIRESGEVRRGFLGVTLGDVPDSQLIGENTRIRGALVYTLSSPNAPAAKAGLQPGDVIVKANDQRVTDRSHLMRIIGHAGVGGEVSLEVMRGEQMMNFEIQLGEFPADLLPKK